MSQPYGFDPTLTGEPQTWRHDQSWQNPPSGSLYPRLDEMYSPPKPMPEGPPVPPFIPQQQQEQQHQQHQPYQQQQQQPTASQMYSPPKPMPEGPPVPPFSPQQRQEQQQPMAVQRDISTPYTAPIPGGRLTPGRMIRVRGVPRGSEFAINLQTGAHGGTIALHLNVRFASTDHGFVVRNSKIRGSWGTEERQGPQFLFRKGVPFEVLVLADGSNYKIAVNNQHFVDYSHRVPVEETDMINIVGDVKVDSVDFY